MTCGVRVGSGFRTFRQLCRDYLRAFSKVPAETICCRNCLNCGGHFGVVFVAFRRPCENVICVTTPVQKLHFRSFRGVRFTTCPASFSEPVSHFDVRDRKFELNFQVNLQVHFSWISAPRRYPKHESAAGAQILWGGEDIAFSLQKQCSRIGSSTI